MDEEEIFDPEREPYLEEPLAKPTAVIDPKLETQVPILSVWEKSVLIGVCFYEAGYLVKKIIKIIRNEPTSTSFLETKGENERDQKLMSNLMFQKKVQFFFNCLMDPFALALI